MCIIVFAGVILPVYTHAADLPDAESEYIQTLSEHDPKAYILAPGDVIHITVYEEDNLSKQYKIDARGMIAMPLINQIQASGLTTSELALQIEKALSDGYFVDPNVAIEITKHQPFYILGEVRIPGQYEYAPGMTVLNAAAIAGGFTYRANRKQAEILRTHSDSVQASYQELPIESKLQGGDIIVIKERFF